MAIRILLSRKLGEVRWTQADLARRTGIRPSTINEMYHEFCERVNLDHIDRICEFLSCDISDLLEYEPNKEKRTGKNLLVESHGRRKKHKNKRLAEGEFLQVFYFYETFLQRYSFFIY